MINVGQILALSFFLMYIVVVEKLNDDCRCIHLQTSNKWDAANSVLQIDKRLRHLSDLQQTPRQYKKKSAEYWESGIGESRSKCPRLANQEQTNENGKDCRGRFNSHSRSSSSMIQTSRH